MNIEDRPGAKARTVEELADDLMLAQELRADPVTLDPEVLGDIAETTGHRGRAIFLVGAGCSCSAKIPLASVIARRAVQILWTRYLPRRSSKARTPEPDKALQALIKAGKLPKSFWLADKTGDWEALYPYIFSSHIKHPNHQRQLISSMVGRKGALNWAHACLGELVSRKYVHTVLTTNFDQLVLEGIIRAGQIPVVADGLESLTRIDPSPSTPQVVHLHGSMHTYDLRNSPKAVKETKADENLKSTMHGLLRQSTLLVIVGYRGGEEGIMDLIQTAADSFSRMVIYWVCYEKDYRNLSPRARRLIETGENTFFIVDQDADEFFQGLMRETKIGQPSWIEDPIQTLVSESVELNSARSDDEIGALVQDYRDRIRFADEHRRAKDDVLLKSLKARSRGAFSDAIELLTPLADGTNYRARRLLAQSFRDRFHDNEGRTINDIQQSIEGFRLLMEADDSPQKFRDVCSFVDATWDLHDRRASSPLSDDDVARLNGMLTVISKNWENRGFNRSQSARLVLYKARVFQELSEKAKQEGGDPKMRREVITAYRKASNALKGDLDDRSREADEGFAGALVADAEFRIKKGGALTSKAELEIRANLSHAIQAHTELTEFAWFNSSSRDWAGASSNLATAYLQLAALERANSDVGRQNALRDAASALEAAILGYQEAGDEKATAQESARLADVNQELAT